MKNAADLATDALTTTTPSRKDSARAAANEPGSDAIKLASATWSRLQSIYGPLWNSRFDAVPKVDIRRALREWAFHLAKYRPDVVRQAIDALPASHPKFPPTLGEFVGQCVYIQKRELDLEAYERAQVRKITKPIWQRIDPETWQQRIREMRQAIGGR